MVAATRRFEDGLQRQILARIFLGGPTAQLLAAGERIGRPDLALRASGGLMGIDGIRKAARELGHQLCRDGVLDQVDDTFFLTYDELIRPLPADARALVAYRRDRREHHAGLELPLSFTGVPVPGSGANPASTAELEIRGHGGSAGRVIGRARVVHDPTEVDLEPGDVLVCHITDPGWSALFTLVDADVGGQASHGAILARELGLPCVVGTVNGTRTIRDGDTIEVDGSAGTVRIQRT